jgi:toxin YoeB
VKILFTEDAWQDYLYWQEHDKKILKKVNELIKEITREPFSGTGKPEALRFALKTTGHDASLRSIGSCIEWQRVLSIAQCRYHYEDEPQ